MGERARNIQADSNLKNSGFPHHPVRGPAEVQDVRTGPEFQRGQRLHGGAAPSGDAGPIPEGERPVGRESGGTNKLRSFREGQRVLRDPGLPSSDGARVSYLSDPRYKINVKLYSDNFKEEVKKFTEAEGVKAILMGNRRTDPYSAELTALCPSS